jgi:hypothetical protein
VETIKVRLDEERSCVPKRLESLHVRAAAAILGWDPEQPGCRALGTGGSDWSEGPKGAEFLAQAVSVFHGCLEICTPEVFPLDHKRARE